MRRGKDKYELKETTIYVLTCDIASDSGRIYGTFLCSLLVDDEL